ncbi:MAG: hypothetical protein AB7P76_07155 [Candidatus Melainabacteria bacterium]
MNIARSAGVASMVAADLVRQGNALSVVGGKSFSLAKLAGGFVSAQYGKPAGLLAEQVVNKLPGVLQRAGEQLMTLSHAERHAVLTGAPAAGSAMAAGVAGAPTGEVLAMIQQLDSNHDGALSQVELSAALEKAQPGTPQHRLMTALQDHFDDLSASDKAAGISLQDIVALAGQDANVASVTLADWQTLVRQRV